MKSLKEFILEGLNGKYNVNNSLAEYLIINCDYNYIVKPLLNENFKNVIKQNKNKGIDFSCSNNEYNSIGIIYSVIYRKENKISVQPGIVENNKFKFSKSNIADDINYLTYIFDNKLCFVNIENIEIKNNSINIAELTPDITYNLTDDQINIYDSIYNIYDNLTPDERNKKQFKTLDCFEEINSILNP